VPFGLVKMLAEGATLPYTLEATATETVYRKGSTVFCRVPTSLHVVLRDVVTGRPWENPGR
jgi:hypothetical protein